MTKKAILNATKYVLAAALLVWVVWSNWSPKAPADAPPDQPTPKGLGYVWEQHVVNGEPVHVGFLAVGAMAYAVGVFITLVRWYLLVRALGLPLSFRDGMRYGLIGVFFNAFLPGSIGGDIVKAAVIARGQSRRALAVASVIMDRAIALLAIICFVATFGGAFLLAGWIQPQALNVTEVIVSVAWAIVGASALVWVGLGFLPEHRAERFAGRLTGLPVVGHSAAEFWRAVWIYRRRQGTVFFVMALTCVGQLAFVSTFFCCANTLWNEALGPVPSLTEHFLLVPSGLIGQAFVPTPGGAGGGEWVFAGLYVLFGGAAVNGLLGSLVQRLLMWVVGIAGYVVYLSTPTKETTPDAEPPLDAEGAVLSRMTHPAKPVTTGP